MFHFVLNTPPEPLIIFAIDSIVMFDWFQDTPDMFKERQNLQKTCKGVIFKNAAAKTRNNF